MSWINGRLQGEYMRSCKGAWIQERKCVRYAYHGEAEQGLLTGDCPEAASEPALRLVRSPDREVTIGKRLPKDN